MFSKFQIDYKENVYEKLSQLTEFENIASGRQGAVLVDIKDGIVPIVRTTTAYNKPAQSFAHIHYDIIEKIKLASGNNELNFNNALIEIYNSQYTKMGYHSDQALDLASNSYICLFSSYDNPPDKPSDMRKLIIKKKESNECSEIILSHNSVVLFSFGTNSEYLHKIVLESNKSNNQWLGITFRLSKTFIHFINEIPYFSSNNKELKVATDDEKKEFYTNRSQENKKIGHVYPEIYYTISASDTICVK